MFDIEFKSSKGAKLGGPAIGTILLGSFRETFESPLHVWRRGDYEEHWVQAVRRLVDGTGSTALITEAL